MKAKLIFVVSIIFITGYFFSCSSATVEQIETEEPQQIQLQREKIEDLQTRIDSTTRALQKFREDSARAIQRKEIEIEELENRAETIQSNLHNEKEKLKRRIANLSDQNTKLKKEYKQRTDELNNQIDELNANIDKLKSDANYWETKQQETEKNLQLHKNEISKLQKQLNKQRNKSTYYLISAVALLLLWALTGAWKLFKK
ncbi:MAG TPA: hypothetical protein VKP78_02480 [bacterium]|nr:hypothetical protein [bacterium]